MDEPSKIVLWVCVGIGFLFLSRLFWLWYWKIDEVLRLLRDISTSLRMARGERALGAPAPWYDDAGALHNESEHRPASLPTFTSKAEYDAWKNSRLTKPGNG